MFKLFGQQKRKTRRLWDSEFNIVKEGLDEKQIIAFVDNLIAQHKASQKASRASLHSLLKQAATDAEETAASIKLKAKTEAEAEAAKIITQASEEAKEIKRRTEVASQEEAEDILSAANRKAEIAEAEAKQKALLFLLRAREEVEKEIKEEYKRAYSRLSSSLQDLVNEGQNIEVELKDKRARLWESKDFKLKEYEAALLGTSEAAVPLSETSAPAETEIEPETATQEKIEESAQFQEETLEEKTDQPTQLQEEATKEEIEAATKEEPLAQPLAGEIPSPEETESAPLTQDSQTLYAGEVELAITTPVDLKTVSSLYNYLQTAPEIKILRTTGSWDLGTTITVALDKPISLINMISKIPEIEVTPELPQQDISAKGTASLLMTAKGKRVKRAKLILKKRESPVGK